MLFRRRANRRIVLARQAFFLGMQEALGAAGRALAAVGKALAVVGCVAAAVWGADRAVRHVVASPRFAVREIRVTPTHHVSRDEIVALGGVREGDRLLSVDADRVAARLATHPYVASARVRRELPGALVYDLKERRRSAVALVGGFYLVDETGHPFKRADLAESEGLPVLTGVDRRQYTAARPAAEAAFREALDVVAAWTSRNGRPPLGEIHVAGTDGFVAYLEGGVEVRLGRGRYADKLARFDVIRGSLSPEEIALLRVVHLEDVTGGPLDRIPVLLAER